MTTLTTPWAYPASAGQFGTGVAWQFVENLIGDTPDTRTRSGGLYDGGGPSAYLYGAGFGFALPAGAVVTGLEIEIRAKAEVSAFDYFWSNAFVVADGALPAGATNLIAAPITIAKNPITTYALAAPAADTGIALTAAQVNASGFGIAMAFYGTAGNKDNDQASIYTLRLRLSYVQGEAPQNVSLTAQGVTAAAPLIGSPGLSVFINTVALGAVPLTAAPPQIAPPGLAQQHRLGAAAPGLAAPLAGAPAVGQTHRVATPGLVSAAPDLPAPRLETRHRLLAAPLLAGTPALDRPVLRPGRSVTRAEGVLALAGQARLESPLLGASTSAVALASVVAAQARSSGQAGTALSLGGNAAARGTTTVRVSADLSLDSQATAQLPAASGSLRVLTLSGTARGRLQGAAHARGMAGVTGAAALRISSRGGAASAMRLSIAADMQNGILATGAGGIVVASVGAAKTRSGVQAGTALSLGGNAAARGTTTVRVSADLSLDSQAAARLIVSVRSVPALAISGAAKARLPGMARSAGLITLTRQGAGVIDVDASGARPLAITGLAAARAGTTARGAGQTEALGHSEARSSSRGSASGGLVLTGAAFGSSVAPSFSEARGALDLAGAGHGAVATRVRLAGESTLHGTVSALLATQGRVSGQIAITCIGSGAVEIDLATARRLPLGGTSAARAAARVTAQPQGAGILVLQGAARAIGPGLVRSSAALDLRAAGQGRVALRATGTGHLRMATPGRGSAAIVGMADGAVPLAATLDTATAGNAAGQSGLDWAGNAQAVRPARGHVTGGLGLAGQSVAHQKISAEAQGRVMVARAVLGDVAVSADSPRGLSLGGESRARNAAAGRSADLPLALAGSAVTQVASCAQGHAALELQGTGRAQAAVAVAVAPELVWGLQATVHAPRRAEGRGGLSLLCVVRARAAITVDADAAVVGLDGRQTGAVGLDAQGQAFAGLTCSSDVTSQVSGPTAGCLTIAQASDAALQVLAEAARAVPLLGAAAAANTAQADGADGALDLGGTADLRAGIGARLRRDGHLLPAGHAQAVAALRAVGQSRVPFTRAGAGDVQVLGMTLRGMTLLGAAAAQARTQGHANLPVAPGLGLSGATDVQAASQDVLFTSRGTLTGTAAVRGAARVLAWDLDMAAIAFRAPPALGRSEPPRQGLSGRLVPTNAGRILRG